VAAATAATIIHWVASALCYVCDQLSQCLGDCVRACNNNTVRGAKRARVPADGGDADECPVCGSCMRPDLYDISMITCNDCGHTQRDTGLNLF
jgi:hypothetical protein